MATPLTPCTLEEHGEQACGLQVPCADGGMRRPCDMGYNLSLKGDILDERRIFSVFLRIPEDYLGVEQSGCNFACSFCHSHVFTQQSKGQFYSIDQLAAGVLNYAFRVTVVEPRDRATFFHSGELCGHSGNCVLRGIRDARCSSPLKREQIVMGPMGFGPARNIASFTGGDLTCRPRYLARVTRKIRSTLDSVHGTPEEILAVIRRDPAWNEQRAKIHEDLSRLQKPEAFYLLLETNGFGLIPPNLDVITREGALDTVCVTVKAASTRVFRQLTGNAAATPDRCYHVIAGAKQRGLLAEAATVLIPGWVEADQIGEMAKKIAQTAGPDVPFSIIGFIPAFRLKAPESPAARPPTKDEMLAAYQHAKDYLTHVKINNTYLFVSSPEEKSQLDQLVGRRLI